MKEFKRTTTVKVKTNYEDLTPEEGKAMRKHVGKMARVVKAPDNTYLEGKKAINSKPRFKVVKGPNNEWLNRKW